MGTNDLHPTRGLELWSCSLRHSTLWSPAARGVPRRERNPRVSPFFSTMALPGDQLVFRARPGQWPRLSCAARLAASMTAHQGCSGICW